MKADCSMQLVPIKRTNCQHSTDANEVKCKIQWSIYPKNMGLKNEE